MVFLKIGINETGYNPGGLLLHYPIFTFLKKSNFITTIILMIINNFEGYIGEPFSNNDSTRIYI